MVFQQLLNGLRFPFGEVNQEVQLFRCVQPMCFEQVVLSTNRFQLLHPTRVIRTHLHETNYVLRTANLHVLPVSFERSRHLGIEVSHLLRCNNWGYWSCGSCWLRVRCRFTSRRITGLWCLVLLWFRCGYERLILRRILGRNRICWISIFLTSILLLFRLNNRLGLSIRISPIGKLSCGITILVWNICGILLNNGLKLFRIELQEVFIAQSFQVQRNLSSV